ncbi:ABC transporter permease [Thalassolituus sp. LLYu03]|uniref:ABC transporter permease n=1 Tax=Thalassolituus sp. LLYu03 TaxID=3421656 RepID=UPI003D26D431
MLFTIAAKSLLQRRLAAALIIAAMSLSLMALLITRSASSELRASFASSVSGTDLIAGARANPLQVLLYSVFRLGTPTQAVSAERWTDVAQLPQVQWSFPLVLGDSVKGFAVIGTNDDYFAHFRFGNKHPLTSQQNKPLAFATPTTAVIGATVGRELGLKPGDAIILSHGAHQHSFHQHKELPFIVSAVLQPTGTPVDRSVHVHLAALEALHNEQWLHRFVHHDHNDDRHDDDGHDDQKHEHNAEETEALVLQFSDLPPPTAISAVFIGLKSRALTFQAQAAINAANSEPLTAVIPGVALTEFWQLIGNAEQILKVLSGLMLVTGLLGSVAMLQVSVAFRQQEIGLLRLIGAHPLYLFALLQVEILLLTGSSWLIALALSALVQSIASPLLASYMGVLLNPQWWPAGTGWLLLISIGLSILAGLLPALSAYRESSHPGAA